MSDLSEKLQAQHSTGGRARATLAQLQQRRNGPAHVAGDTLYIRSMEHLEAWRLVSGNRASKDSVWELESST